MTKIKPPPKESIDSPHYQVIKNDFIKFNVSPEFKALAVAAAQKYGMSISELGWVLFATFITGIAKPSSELSLDFYSHLKRNHRFNSIQDALDYLNQPAEE